MGEVIDLGKYTRLGPAEPRAGFFIAGVCPQCGMPVFVHDTEDAPDYPRAFYPTCGHDPGITATYPSGEDIAREREAVETIWTMLAQAVMAAARLEATVTELAEERAAQERLLAEIWETVVLPSELAAKVSAVIPERPDKEE